MQSGDLPPMHDIVTRLRLSIALFAICLTGANAQMSSQDCYRFDTVDVVLSGRLTRVRHFGPPGYGEDPRHDTKETAVILCLDTPICVMGASGSDDEDERNVREMQLAMSDEAWKQYASIRSIVGPRKRVTVRGELFHAHTGHHIRQVLMLVKGIRIAAP
jgi:hypothetical protein